MVSSRELASLIWIGVAAIGLSVLLIRSREGRASLVGVLRALAHPKVLVSLLAFFAYISACVWVADVVGAWTSSMLKETLIWTIISSFAVIFASTKADKDPDYFRKAFVAVFGINVVVEFIFGLVSFAFWLEFVLQPVLALLILLELVARQNAETPVAKAVDWLLAGLGFAFLGGTLLEVWSQSGDMDWVLQLRTFAMLVWLPITTIPFIYSLAWVMTYERVILQLRFRLGDERVPTWMKAAVAVGFNRNLHDLGRIRGRGPYEVARSSSFREALDAVRDARRRKQEEDLENAEAAARLQRFAGVGGVDEDGRRLDRREFAETQRALRWVATCHVGWYRRDDSGRYREDLLTILGDISSHGLPEPHGVEMRVSESGQSWYAWRRTVSNWVFAIGASGPPPSEWLYDGPDPPTGFPGSDPAWGDEPFRTPVNWRG
ncbi:MAG: hypothetical protein GEU93_17350 [Propionibacteriales bacterium]|nr:hypothetical protein [Propionibacteriales bacterium]